MNITLTEMTKHFLELQKESQKDYETSLIGLVGQIGHSDNGKSFIRSLVAQVGGPPLEFDLEEMLSKVEPPPPPKAPAFDKKEVFAALKNSIPNLATEAEMELVMTAMDALRLASNLYLGGDVTGGDAAKNGLLMILEVMQRAKVVQDSADLDVPNVSGKYTKPPEDFHTDDPEVQAILAEVEGITSMEALQVMYDTAQERVAQIRDSKSRGAIYQAITEKKKALS